MTYVEHVRRELELVGEEPETVEKMVKVAQAWSEFGHSGGSHLALLPVLTALLNHEVLSPLTDNPDEWVFHEGEKWPPNGIWQNVRNSKAFSEDEGKTYWLLSEDNSSKYKRIHTSETYIPKAETPSKPELDVIPEVSLDPEIRDVTDEEPEVETDLKDDTEPEDDTNPEDSTEASTEEP